MVIMGIETGIKDRIATAYDNILQVAFANASRKWSNLMSGIEESATVLMTEEQMEERRRLAEQGMAQGSESESGDSLEAMLAAGLPPLQPASATTAVSTQPSNVIPLNAAQPGPAVAPCDRGESISDLEPVQPQTRPTPHGRGTWPNFPDACSLPAQWNESRQSSEPEH